MKSPLLSAEGESGHRQRGTQKTPASTSEAKSQTVLETLNLLRYACNTTYKSTRHANVISNAAPMGGAPASKTLPQIDSWRQHGQSMNVWVRNTPVPAYSFDCSEPEHVQIHHENKVCKYRRTRWRWVQRWFFGVCHSEGAKASWRRGRITRGPASTCAATAGRTRQSTAAGGRLRARGCRWGSALFRSQWKSGSYPASRRRFPPRRCRTQ